jgi:osmotically-inducible protein OsmY
MYPLPRRIAVVLATILSLPSVAAVRADTRDLRDQDITLAVENQLFVDFQVPSHRIDVTSDAGVVTLTGSVDSLLSKRAAERAAESVKGVLDVINELDVIPPMRPDARIRADIIQSLALDPVAESFEVEVEVENGVVTLDGKLGSYTEVSVVEEIAREVNGVKEVQSNLTYDPAGDRTDADIREDLRYRLRSDASIASGLIEIDVDDGKVTLSGSVGSTAERSEARTEAWLVTGVKSVKDNLEVKWWLNGEASDWGDGWSDADMRRAIEIALIANPRVMSYNVIPTVQNGVVSLTGTVEDLEAKQAAEDEALDVLGVWRVKNHIRVRPVEERTDLEIANDIRGALRRAPYVDRYDIKVRVYNGKACLSGEVDSWYMRDHAEQAAAGVSGVIEIQNNLAVDYQMPLKTDREIKDDIESELFWSPFVDSDDITVEVHSGVATLMGSVEDWAELRAAKENAREGGATSVVSSLKIENGDGSS